MNMELLLAIILWIVFAVITAVAGRIIAVRWAKKRGWSALTMPMIYHVSLITVYLVIVQIAWIALYAWLIY